MGGFVGLKFGYALGRIWDGLGWGGFLLFRWVCRVFGFGGRVMDWLFMVCLGYFPVSLRVAVAVGGFELRWLDVGFRVVWLRLLSCMCVDYVFDTLVCGCCLCLREWCLIGEEVVSCGY